MTAEINLWECLQMRVTTFHVNLRTELNSAVIAPLFGMEPDSIEVKPSQMRRFEVATLGPGRLTFTSTGNRVDWVWQSIEDVEGPRISLGTPVNVIEQFLPSIQKWIAAQQDVVRIALGGHFGIRVEDKLKGYKKLDSLIDELVLDPEKTSEFMYQINRPSKEDFSGEIVSFNNLEKWGCLQVTQSAVSFSVGSLMPVQHNSIVVESFASCELDINTDASNVNPFLLDRSTEILIRASSRLREFLENRK